MRTAVGWLVFVLVFMLMGRILEPYARTQEYPISFQTWLIGVSTFVVAILAGVVAARLIPKRKPKAPVLTELQALEQEVAARIRAATYKQFASQASDVVGTFGQNDYFEERAHQFRIDKTKEGLTITSRGVLVFSADYRSDSTREIHVSKAYVRDSEGNYSEEEAHTVPVYVPGKWIVTAYLPGLWEEYLTTVSQRAFEYKIQQETTKSAEDEKARIASARKFLGMDS